MTKLVNTAPAWLAAHWILAAIATVLALAVLAIAVRLAAAMVRRVRAVGLDFADTVTVVVALFATGYAATGSNKYLGVAMGYGPDLRAALLVVYEGAVVVSGIRARKNIRETGAVGVDGVAMWVLTVLSGVLSASVSGNIREAAGRLVVPAVGAWLWERAMAPEKRAARQASGPVRWRITAERVFVWLRLADATDTDVSTVDAGRKVAQYLRVTDRKANKRRWPFTAEARAGRAEMRLTLHALMHSGDPAAVYAALAEHKYAAALTRLGISRPGPAVTSAETAAQTHEDQAVNNANAQTVTAQLSPINTPVDSAAGLVLTGTGQRPDTGQAEQIIRYGWENSLGVRETARLAERDPGQVSRTFARLDAEHSARPAAAPVLAGVNGGQVSRP